MTQSPNPDHVRTAFLKLIEETFDKGYTAYLDRGTSLFETLDDVTAARASRTTSASRSSIAAHVAHLRFYMDVTQRSMRGEALGEIDWKGSWSTQHVTAEEWEALKSGVRQTYTGFLAAVKGADAWDRVEDVTDALAVLAHTAYHLGAIRMALGTVPA